MSTSAQHRRQPSVSTIGRLLKAAGAAIGAAIILGMGTFSVTVTDSAAIAQGQAITQPAPAHEPQTITQSAPAHEPQTIIQTAPPREPETPFAKPTMTAPRFGGWCDKCSSNAATTPTG